MNMNKKMIFWWSKTQKDSMDFWFKFKHDQSTLLVKIQLGFEKTKSPKLPLGFQKYWIWFVIGYETAVYMALIGFIIIHSHNVWMKCKWNEDEVSTHTKHIFKVSTNSNVWYNSIKQKYVNTNIYSFIVFPIFLETLMLRTIWSCKRINYPNFLLCFTLKHVINSNLFWYYSIFI